MLNVVMFFKKSNTKERKGKEKEMERGRGREMTYDHMITPNDTRHCSNLRLSVLITKALAD